MDTFIRFLQGQSRLILTLTFAATAAGAVAWQSMPRLEDPRIPERAGLVVAVWPGADAARVERLVVRPIEDELAQVAEIKHVDATARADVAVLSVQLRDRVVDTDAAWDEVDDALAKARADLPEGVLPLETDYALMDVASVVLAVTGTDDRLALRRAAEAVQDAVVALPGVTRAELVADPDEEVVITLDDAAARRLGLSVAAMQQLVASRARTVAAGAVQVGARRLVLDARGGVDDLATLRALPVPLAAGGSVPLGRVAQVQRQPRAPARDHMRVDGRSAVGLAVVPQVGVDLVALGDRIQAEADRVAGQLGGLTVHTVSFQPARVGARLAELGRSLLLGVAIVAGVLLLFMGLRLGLVVSAVVPLVTFTSLAVYALAGGVLQQIAVAGLVIALGLLVDNAVVVAERVQAGVDAGAAPRAAAMDAVRELFWPLAASTVTTLASFLPLMLSDGASGDFTRSIPQIVMLTLALSFVFAVAVTPALAAAFFRPGRAAARAGQPRWAKTIAGLPVRHPGWVILAVLALLVGAASLAPRIKQQFFPSADRNQAVLEIALPEGTHLSATDAAARTLERALMTRPDVTGVATFVGRSTPPFYYNLPRVPRVPHVAQFIVRTRTAAQVPQVIEAAREAAADALPGVVFVGKTLEQGPPLRAPIELRLFADDPDQALALANRVHGLLAARPELRDVRHDAGLGSPVVDVAPLDEAVARRGASRADLSVALLGRTLGLPAGQDRAGRTPVPIRVRAPEGEALPPAALRTVDVALQAGVAGLPLAAVASPVVRMEPSVLSRRDRGRVVRVLAELEKGKGFNGTLAAVLPDAQRLVDAVPGARLEVGGAAESSDDANQAIAAGAPAATLVLVLALLFQFRSFRRVALVMTTIPLAAVGVVPGLVLFDQPFGFTSLLGTIALAGIVVNNAIILLDVADTARAEGATVGEALERAVGERLRPILLTTITTVAGLVPLLFSSATLWPPLASAMISGLTASTLLTLLVVPAGYRLLFGREGRKGPPHAAALAVALVLPGVAGAAPLSLGEALTEGARRPGTVGAAEQGVLAADAAARAATRGAFLPTVSVEVQATRRQEAIGAQTPIGPFVQTERTTVDAAVVLQQPLFDLARQRDGRAAADARATAARADARARRLDGAIAAGSAWLDVHALDAALDANRAYREALAAQRDRLRALVEGGRALEPDALRVAVALADAEREGIRLTAQRRAAEAQLARALGREKAPAPGPLRVDEAALEARLGRAATVAQRPALAALSAQRQAVRAERSALLAGYLPTVALDARYLSTTNAPVNPDRWWQAGLVLRWTPFAGDVRRTQAQALAAQAQAVALERRAARRGFAAAAVAARAALEAALAEWRVARRAVDQATRSATLVRAQFEADRATLTDVLQVEAALQAQRTRTAVARIEAVRAALRLDRATGEAPRPPAG